MMLIIFEKLGDFDTSLVVAPTDRLAGERWQVVGGHGLDVQILTRCSKRSLAMGNGHFRGHCSQPPTIDKEAPLQASVNTQNILTACSMGPSRKRSPTFGVQLWPDGRRKWLLSHRKQTVLLYCDRGSNQIMKLVAMQKCQGDTSWRRDVTVLAGHVWSHNQYVGDYLVQVTRQVHSEERFDHRYEPPCQPSRSWG